MDDLDALGFDAGFGLEDGLEEEGLSLEGFFGLGAGLSTAIALESVPFGAGAAGLGAAVGLGFPAPLLASLSSSSSFFLRTSSSFAVILSIAAALVAFKQKDTKTANALSLVKGVASSEQLAIDAL